MELIAVWVMTAAVERLAMSALKQNAVSAKNVNQSSTASLDLKSAMDQDAAPDLNVASVKDVALVLIAASEKDVAMVLIAMIILK